MVTMLNNTVAYLKVAKRVKSSSQEKKIFVTMYVMCVNWTYFGDHFIIYADIKPLLYTGN